MIKNKVKADDNGTMEVLAQAIRDIGERLDDIEEKRDASGVARLLITERLYNTDRKHLPELTRISLRMVDPLSLADTAAAVLDEDVQEGKTSLGQKRQESIYRHLRSVGGKLLNDASELAKEQTRTAEVEAAEQWEAGK